VGTLGGSFSAALGLNDRGWAAGIASLPGDQATHAFLETSGKLTDLGTLGGPNSDVGFTPFRDDGTLTGDAETAESDPTGADFCFHGTQLICRPVVWHNGRVQILPTLGGNNGVANQINGRGEIAGVAENTSFGPACFAPGNVFEFKPVLYSSSDIHELPTFPGDPNGVALAINARGQVAGFSFSCDDFHALLWQHGHLIDLGNLGGMVNNNASAINDRGEIAGVSGLTGNVTAHAFLWRRGVMKDLGTIPGDFSSVGIGLNNRSEVVGQSCNEADDFCRAFVWRKGTMWDLNALLPPDTPWFLFEADTINSRGQIVGLGFRFDLGEVHGYVVTPCSEDDSASDQCEDALPNTFANQGPARLNQISSLPQHIRRLIQERRSRQSRIFGWSPQH
jgi:probable HAF family extracellular repeat protein